MNSMIVRACFSQKKKMIVRACFLSQAECDELAQRAEVLKEENASLRSEVSRIRSEYDQLLAENASLKVMVGSGFVLMGAFSLFTNIHLVVRIESRFGF